MQNEARFEFVLIEGGENPPGEGTAPERGGGLEETNRLLQRILEAQGFRKLGGDGADQQPKKPVSAEDLATLPVEPTRPVDIPGAVALDPRAVKLPPSPTITPRDATKPPDVPRPVERPTPTPPEPEATRIEPTKPPEPATVKPDTSLEEMHQKFRDETKQITDKLMDDLFGERRRRRDAEKGIIQAELVAPAKPPEPIAPTKRETATPPKPVTPPEDRIPQTHQEMMDILDPSPSRPGAAPSPKIPASPAEDPLERSKREWDDLQNNFARDWANERRQRANEARERMGLPIKPLPGVTPAVPAELPPVPPPAMVTIPKSIPAIGGMAVSGATVAAASGVAAGVVGVAAIAKANYELLQSMDTLAKRLSPTLVDYSPEVAAAQAAADLREVMRTISTSDRLGETVGRLVEANSILKDSMVQIRDVIAGPIMQDAATIKEGLASALAEFGDFMERNQSIYDTMYYVATRYLPGPQSMIGKLVKVAEILKKVTDYEEKKNEDFGFMFMGDGMITPPGWDNASEVNVPMSFANPGVELP